VQIALFEKACAKVQVEVMHNFMHSLAETEGGEHTGKENRLGFVFMEGTGSWSGHVHSTSR
jgi:hypothetical protein